MNDGTQVEQIHRPDVEPELVNRKVDFTKELARQIISLPEFVGERPLRDSHVAFLIGEAKRGTFLADLASLITCDCTWDGVERRLNGQHTSWMREYMPDDWNIKIRIIKYRAPTEDDFRRLYAAIDRNAPRSNSHVLQVRVFGTETFKGVSKDMIRILGSGLRYYVDDKTRRSTVDSIGDLMENKYSHIVLKIADFLSDVTKDGAHVKRGPVVGAMFGTFEKSASDSIQFWQAVKTGIGLDNVSDPRNRLRNTLMQTSIHLGRGSQFKKTMIPQDVLTLCLHCWNLWRKGEKITNLRMPEKRPAVK